MSPLVLLNYPLDKQQLIEEANYIKSQAVPYTDPRYEGSIQSWLMCRHTSEYSKRIMKDFEVYGKPRYYWLAPFAHIPEHTDNGTACSINFILSEDIAPVTICGKDYTYQQALLNTSILHSVTNGPTERLLFKISISNISYEELSSIIKYRSM